MTDGRYLRRLLTLLIRIRGSQSAARREVVKDWECVMLAYGVLLYFLEGKGGATRPFYGPLILFTFSMGNYHGKRANKVVC